MAGLMSATALESTGGQFGMMLDPGWNIWGPAGGYIAAIALRAVREHAAAEHRPLTLSGQFVRVAKPGLIEVTVDTVKQGTTALYAVTLAQDGRPIFLAQVWTSARSETSLPVSPLKPDVPPPHSLRGQDEIVAERGINQIAFWQNIEGRPANFRVATDPPAADTHQHRWMRMRDWTPTQDAFLNAMRYAVLIDIGVWPAHWHRLTETADYVAPSLDIWVHFHTGAVAGDWLLSDADTDLSGHGTISGRVRIWSEEGQLLATGGGQCLVTKPRALTG